MENRQDMVAVPSNPSQRKKWINRLGQDFEARIQKQKRPHVCLQHFSNKKKKNPKAQLLPLKVKKVVQKNEFDENNNILLVDLDESINSDNEETDDPEYKWHRNSSKNDYQEDIEYFLCSFEMIRAHIEVCHQCLLRGRHSKAKLFQKVNGAAITVKMECPTCLHSWEFVSSKEVKRTEKRGKKKFLVNHDLSTGILITGNGYNNIAALFELLAVPFMSQQCFQKYLRSAAYPAVEQMYQEQQKVVMEKVLEYIVKDGSIDICGDAQFDSRGYSAMICRYTIMHVATKLVLQMTVIKKNRGESSAAMEPLGHSISMNTLIQRLEALVGKTNVVRSFTSDRCSSMESLMAAKFPTITHYFDNWHWIKSVVMELSKKLNQKQFIPVKPWFRKFVNHIYFAIHDANGDGPLAFQKLMSFFHHIADTHTKFQNIDGCRFSKIKKCGHDDLPPKQDGDVPYLDLDDSADRKAWNLLKDAVTKNKRSKDLLRVSPHFNTSALESFHSLATKTAPKEKFFSTKGHEVRSDISAIDWNHKQMEEMAGRRGIIGEKTIYCKTKKQMIKKVKKDPCTISWRREILAKSRILNCELDEHLSDEEYQASEDDEFSEYDDFSEDEVEEMDIKNNPINRNRLNKIHEDLDIIDRELEKVEE